MELRNYTNKLLNYLLPWRHNMTATTKTATLARTPNYSDVQVATMIERYTSEPTRATVDAIAREFNKNSRSIIAKLVREGVYQAAPRVTKTGAPVVRKAEYVRRIETIVGVSMPSLSKASKSDLESLVAGLDIAVSALDLA